jgi:hypothetical protein
MYVYSYIYVSMYARMQVRQPPERAPVDSSREQIRGQSLLFYVVDCRAPLFFIGMFLELEMIFFYVCLFFVV